MLHPTFLEQDVRLVGHRWSPRVHELKRFLARSGGGQAIVVIGFACPEPKGLEDGADASSRRLGVAIG